jgi:hypothetical protein
MSSVITRWLMISAMVYFGVHLAVLILRLNGVVIGGVQYGN